jgi:hypothetical protein
VFSVQVRAEHLRPPSRRCANFCTSFKAGRQAARAAVRRLARKAQDRNEHFATYFLARMHGVHLPRA